MMNIQEAIEHAREQAKRLGACACAKEHEQLAGWLEELVELRKSKPKSEDEINFMRYASKVGLKSEDFGRTFSSGNYVFTVDG